MNFRGKVVIVTGGSSGIGKATALELVKLGAKVVISGRREQVLFDAANEIDPTGAHVHVVAEDIRHPETSTKIVEETVKQFGGIDILISRSGIFKPTPFLAAQLSVLVPCGQLKRSVQHLQAHTLLPWQVDMR